MAQPTLVPNGSLELNCLIEGEYAVFLVTMGRNDAVSNFKKAIRRERKDSILRGVDPHTLELWKPKDSNPIDSRPDHTLAERIRSLRGLSTFADKLGPTSRLFSIFPGQPPLHDIHIIVKLPAIATISSNESNASSVPSFSDHWSPRATTVHRLYNILMKEHLVHVRGTPGCGKTTLMNLLHAFILQRAPSAFVHTQHSWPPAGTGPSLGPLLDERLRLLDHAFPRRDGLAYLLFDEGQDSYEDHFFWNGFFKGVVDGLYSHYRVVLFCSYGSPSSRPVPHHIGTPLVLRDAARISLWPQEPGSVGILLNRPEFDEVVSLFDRPVDLHPDLLDLIFEWTVGHVGAVVEMLRVISCQRVSEVRYEQQLTVKNFYDENPTHILVQNLSGGAFGRGLPTTEDLSDQPDMVALFRDLLKNLTIVKTNRNKEAIRKCHRHGWIHANQTVNGSCYVFPSPLHAVCVSWRLEALNNTCNFTSLSDLAIKLIAGFKPSQPQLQVRVEPGSQLA